MALLDTQTLVFVDVVNSKPITVREPEVDAFERIAVDDFSQFWKMKIYIVAAALLFVVHAIRNRTVVTCLVKSHVPALLVFLLRYRATGMPEMLAGRSFGSLPMTQALSAGSSTEIYLYDFNALISQAGTVP